MSNNYKEYASKEYVNTAIEEALESGNFGGGTSSSIPPMIVTVSNGYASHSPEEINTHFENGGEVYLQDEEWGLYRNSGGDVDVAGTWYFTYDYVNLDGSQTIREYEIQADKMAHLTETTLPSEAQVDALVSAIPKFSIEVVTSLPTADISNTTVYLVKSSDETNNLYDEYIYVNNGWEHLGSQTVDISSKMDKVTGGTNGNFITLDTNGNAVDSGKNINNSFVPMVILNQAIGPHLGDNTIHVTADEKAAWNAKSDFSGSYNDLTDLPTSVRLVDEVTSTIYTLKVSNGQLVLKEVTE